MTCIINARDTSGKSLALLRHIEKILLTSAKKLKLKNIEIDVTLVSDRTIQSLNRKYRHKNKPTDVLSFSQKDMVIEGRTILGDIIIAKETTKKQARAAGKTIQQEFAMLAVHGLLHLLGYDHEKKKEEIVMFDLQSQLLEFAKKHSS